MNNSNNLRANVLFEIAFFERLVTNNPDFIDALMPLAQAYTEVGDYQKGLSVDKRLSRLLPQDGIVFYNLACSFALLTMTDEAILALQKAIKLGYNDLKHMLKDTDLETIRTDTRFSRLVAILKKRDTPQNINMKY